MPYNTLIHTRRTPMKINGYEIKPDAYLMNADLRGANLGSVYLVNANLRDANLWYANLWYANLVNADLYGADLRGANLYGADVTGTILEKKKDDKDLKIKELEEELKKYKDTLKALLDT